MDLLILIIALIIVAETSVLVLRKGGAGRAVYRGGDRAILVDTSVLIDGRILDIAQAGFAPGRLVIPRSVLGELQLLADGSDHEKRARARNGLEAVTKLQEMPRVSMEIYGDQSDAREGVDNRLLALARQLGYELCTVDYNLQKVAEAEGIAILSINDLAQKLRALYLPGEKLDLLLKQKGQEKGQAIGYASDGTMVVVDSADKLMNQTVQVEVIRSLQTSSGKMMFGKLVNQDKSRDNGRKHDNDGKGQRGRKLFSRDKQQRPQQNQPQAQQNPQVPQEAAQPTQPKQNNQRRSNDAPKKAIGLSRRPRQSQSPEDELLNLVNNQDR